MGGLYTKNNTQIRIVLSWFFFFVSVTANAQVFWTEDFGTGCSQGTLANGYPGTNGAWSVSNTGTNDTYANVWYVSATEAGMGTGNCGDGCGSNASLINRTLHLGPAPVFGDAGATYNAGGACGIGICVVTDRRVESPTINCNGYDNISVSFNYFMQGQAGADYAALAYYDGTSWTYYNGSSWTSTLTSLVASNNSTCAGQGYWTAYTAQLPLSAHNNSNVKIGFRWINNDDGIGTDPSFAVDNITLSGTSALTCSVYVFVSDQITCYGGCNGALTAIASGTPPFNYSWSSLDTTAIISNVCSGIYSVMITDSNGCTSSTTDTILQPGQIGINANVSPISCYGDCTGSITPIVSGGTPPYAYQWSNGNGLNLCAGSYTLFVTDVNGCVDSLVFVVPQPNPLVPGNLITNNPTCTGCNDGTICLGTASGGTFPYSYAITPSATFNGNCFVNLTQGTYTICVTDAYGCAVCQNDTLSDPPTGIADNFSPVEISIYPNPFTTTATLEVSGLQFAVYSLVIHDVLGSVIRKSEIRNQKTEIARAGLQNGIYFFDLINEKKEVVWRGKFVVH